MIKYCLEKWNKYKGKLEKNLRADTTLNECEYIYLVKKTVSIILNNSEDENEDRHLTWDINNITQIDNGDYQGTLLFLIPQDVYQPAEHEYLMACVRYGSCSGCDTLLAIQNGYNEKLSEWQVKDFMKLCQDLICSMIKPYNNGIWHDERFETVEFNND